MKKITGYVPNTLTCINLILGCVSCVMAFQENFLWAACFIYLASIFDFLDGMAARVLKAHSDIGKELDSLADMVSFGMAPGIIFFSWLNKILPAELNYLSYAAFLIPVFSALRLAKFNIDIHQTSSFIGLPTPASAIFIASFVALGGILSTPACLLNLLNNPWVITCVILLFSFLLVCNLPMFSLKFKNLHFKENATRYLFLLISLLLIIYYQWIGIPLVILFFIGLSLFLFLYRRKKK